MPPEHPLKLVTVNSAPERAQRLVGRVIESFRGQYSIVHAANAENPEVAREVFKDVFPDLVFTASMWTQEESARVLTEAREINPHVKTLAIPQGLQVESGPEAVIEYLRERIPGLLQD